MYTHTPTCAYKEKVCMNMIWNGGIYHRIHNRLLKGPTLPKDVFFAKGRVISETKMIPLPGMRDNHPELGVSSTHSQSISIHSVPFDINI